MSSLLKLRGSGGLVSVRRFDSAVGMFKAVAQNMEARPCSPSTVAWAASLVAIERHRIIVAAIARSSIIVRLPLR